MAVLVTQDLIEVMTVRPVEVRVTQDLIEVMYVPGDEPPPEPAARKRRQPMWIGL